MADILALFGVILLGGAALSALLTTHWLLFPGGVTQVLAWVVMVAALAVSGLGTAGLVRLMADRIRSRGGTGWSEVGAFVRSSLVLELAAVLPIVGWFVILPLVVLGSFGASLHALRRPIPADP